MLKAKPHALACAVLLVTAACVSCGHASQPQAAVSPSPGLVETSTTPSESETPSAPQSPPASGAGGAIAGQIGQVLQALASPSPGSPALGMRSPQPEWTPSGQGVPTVIPLQVGLTIVTAGQSPDGDLESYKRVTALDSSGMTFSFDSKLQYSEISAIRTTSNADLDHAHKFFPDFCNGTAPKYYASDEIPVQGDHPGSTTLQISRAAFTELQSRGATSMTFYPSTFCMAMADATPAPVQKIDEGGVPIILNDKSVAVAALHFHGGREDCLQIPAAIRFGCYDLWVLKDPNDPLVLRFVIEAEQMQVIKISQAGLQAAIALEATLAAKQPADVYGIYFDFNQATIKPQSEPALAAIARLLLAHPDWKLKLDGHTDSIGSAEYNLALSRRRAESVKSALVSRYHIAPDRLTTGGYGATRPKATNSTLEGRALNRRVELTRTSG